MNEESVRHHLEILKHFEDQSTWQGVHHDYLIKSIDDLSGKVDKIQNDVKIQDKNFQFQLTKISKTSDGGTTQDNNLDLIEKNFNLSSEILNSIEDMKQVTSSIPNNYNDLFPNVEKVVSKCASEFMEQLNDMKSESKGILEESQNHNSNVMKRFDIIEHRFAVIRKYVKQIIGR